MFYNYSLLESFLQSTYKYFQQLWLPNYLEKVNIAQSQYEEINNNHALCSSQALLILLYLIHTWDFNAHWHLSQNCEWYNYSLWW